MNSEIKELNFIICKQCEKKIMKVQKLQSLSVDK